MKTFYERTDSEKDIIKKAYQYEIEAIENNNLDSNPYLPRVLSMEDGKDVWEAINVAIELKYL